MRAWMREFRVRLLPEERGDPFYGVNNMLWPMILEQDSLDCLQQFEGVFPPARKKVAAWHTLWDDHTYEHVVGSHRAQAPGAVPAPSSARRGGLRIPKPELEAEPEVPPLVAAALSILREPGDPEDMPGSGL